jgi:hypothetical protein
MKQRFIRPNDPLRDDEIVVRGGPLDGEEVIEDALTVFDIYGVYALSVFALRETTLDELAQQPPLIRYPELTLVRAGVIRAAGLRLVPSGRGRQHFSIEFDELTDGLERLRTCERRSEANPYHGP